MKKTLIASLLLAVAVSTHAKVDLVTLPGRDKTQVTIYNSADLTLLRETRTLTLKKGENRLQYSWAGTLIDPTSLELTPKGGQGGVEIRSVEYPPRVTGLGIWNIEAARAGKTPFEITSFTSGLTWRAYYLATLEPGEESMRLEGYVRVDNRSGEDLENAETRLVVGRINLLEEVAMLAARPQPYGHPQEVRLDYWAKDEMRAPAAEGNMPMAAKAMMADMRVKEIVKEGLSEYFLYTIEGTEDLSNGWGKRLVSFAADGVKIDNLYRFEEERYGPKPVRFLKFVNDKAHNLGKEPIPDGLVKVYRNLDAGGGLAYVGAENTKYIPVGGEVNLALGPTDLVTVKPLLMDYRTDNYDWKNDQITGFDEHTANKVEVANNLTIPVKVEVRRNFRGSRWELENEGDQGKFEKIDADTVQYTLELPPGAKKTFSYRLHLHTGSRAL